MGLMNMLSLAIVSQFRVAKDDDAMDAIGPTVGASASPAVNFPRPRYDA